MKQGIIRERGGNDHFPSRSKWGRENPRERLLFVQKEGKKLREKAPILSGSY